ncbi:hypothetical protein WDZ17_02755 [Pseudokineococcus basanitobsidens]|uniref:Uncharacterized protein n=1 Tax=Pseudokineococcus basanitobsidens TaxID=1926649 RepID=A0ABU8RGJ9_9ACTN
MSELHADADRSASDLLVEAVTTLSAGRDLETREGSLQLVRTASEVEAGARTVLHQAVLSARTRGNTWASIGAVLGMTKQAAQKRFATTAIPSGADLAADERILGPVGPFDEMRELALAGQYGWHSVEAGLNHHRVMHSPTRWEHRRVSGARAARRLTDQGWQLVGGNLGYTYLKRDLGTPALIEPAHRA